MARPSGSTKKVETPIEVTTPVEVVVEPTIVKAPTPPPAPAPAPKKYATQIDRSEMIPVRSVCYGNLTYVSKRTGMITTWGEFGAIEWIEFGELITMKSSSPKFFTKPWIIIENEEVVEFLGLAQKYKEMIDVENIEEFFRKPIAEIKSLIKASPKGIQETITLKARDMIREETLTDIRVIRALDDEFKLGLLDMMK